MSNEADLYARIFPFILRDFMTKDDISALLLFNFIQNKMIFTDINTELGIDTANYYKNLIENGEDLSEKIKPIIEL